MTTVTVAMLFILISNGATVIVDSFAPPHVIVEVTIAGHPILYALDDPLVLWLRPLEGDVLTVHKDMLSVDPHATLERRERLRTRHESLPRAPEGDLEL